MSGFLARDPDAGEEVKVRQEQLPFQEVFPYHEYEFGHENKFGFRGYVYDIDSGGKNAVLRVSKVFE